MDKISVLDFGGQYTQLIAKNIRKLNVYSEILSSKTELDKLRDSSGLILSGGPMSVYDPNAPRYDPRIFSGEKPVLGICYGMQALAKESGGEIGSDEEYGETKLLIEKGDSLFDGLDKEQTVWMSHGDSVASAGQGFEILGRTGNGIIAAIGNPEKKLYGVQFHPEVTHTPEGKKILANFVYKICECKPEWTMENYIDKAIEDIREQVGDNPAIALVSGGVDSIVATTLAQRVIEELYAIHIDNGLMRKNESREVAETLRKVGVRNFQVKDYSDWFLNALSGITDPEKKREVIGNKFVEVLQEEIRYLGLGKKKNVYIIQGTLYTDLIESGKGVGKKAARIKTHHNVGAPLIEEMRERGLVVEPNREIFKDEVRKVGELLHLPREVIYRHPFPGPGLAVRILGEVTRERLDTLREADEIYIEEIKRAGLYRNIWQAFAGLIPIKTVGVMGDTRTYENVIMLRAVTSKDGMTADSFSFSENVKKRISTRIVNEVNGVNRVFYDWTTKPPATIEWE